MKTVLKYPGSKWRIANKLCELIPPHHSYLEAFAGSMAVLFNKKPSSIETVNDLDSNVVNLFRCIKEDPERLSRMVISVPFSREVYEEQYKKDLPSDNYEKAVSFLVKCWQGYGYRTNDYRVGWKRDVHGREKAYALWDWYQLPERVIEVAERLRMVQIENMPAIELMKGFSYEDVFMYLDPPYLLGIRNGKNYKHEMDDEAHEELLKFITRTPAKVMLSGYSSEMYEDYLSGWKRMEFISQAQGGKRRTEVVWMNYEVGDTYQLNINDFL